MADEFGLVLRADSRGVDRGVDSLDNLARAANRAEKENNDLGSSIANTSGKLKGYAAIVGAVVGALATSKLVTVTRDFQQFQAQLTTSTGSAENAAVAFDALQQFATTTPFTLDQSIEAFNQLVNLGLTPSERALTSYGDTASAMGKDLTQMVQAVSNATTGEFENLKQFGVKSKKVGDEIAFTFRGQTTMVANDAASIEEFMVKLGETNFSGSMVNQMNTLNGAISNLEDGWDNLWRVVSEQGAGNLIQEGVMLAADAVAELTAMLESGQLGAMIGSVGEMFTGFGTDAKRAFDIIKGLIKGMGVDWDGVGTNLSVLFDKIVVNFPANVRAMVKILVVEFANFFEKTVVLAQGFVDRVKAIFTDDTWSAVNARVAQDLKALDVAYETSIKTALADRDATIAASKAKLAESERLRAAYDAEAAAKKEANKGVDQLAQFAGPRAESAAPSEGSSKADKKAAEEAKKRLDTLREQFAGAEALEEASYAKRKLDLNEYSAAVQLSEQEKNVILEQLAQEHQDKLYEIRAAADGPDAREQRLMDLEQQFLTESELEQIAYEQKLVAFQEYSALKQLSEAEQNAMLQAMQQEHETRMNAIRLNGMTEAQRIQNLSMASQVALVAGGLSDMLSAFDNGSGKFIKAARIAGATQALVATLVGQAESLKLGWPLGPLAALKIAAAGAGFISAIKGGGRSSPSRSSVSPPSSSEISSLAGGAEGLQARPPTQAKQVVDFRFSTGGRKLFRDEEVKEMMQSMADRAKDGDYTLGSITWTA